MHKLGLKYHEASIGAESVEFKRHWHNENGVIFLAQKFLCDFPGNSREDYREFREHRAKERFWHNFTHGKLNLL